MSPHPTCGLQRPLVLTQFRITPKPWSLLVPRSRTNPAQTWGRGQLKAPTGVLLPSTSTSHTLEPHPPHTHA